MQSAISRDGLSGSMDERKHRCAATGPSSLTDSPNHRNNKQRNTEAQGLMRVHPLMRREKSATTAAIPLPESRKICYFL
jgi:hypothetical protein